MQKGYNINKEDERKCRTLMRTKQELVIGYDKGIHTRVAAMIVQKTTELESRYGCRIYLKRAGSTLMVQANSVLPLVGMKLLKGECIEIFGDGTKSSEAVAQLCAFIEAGAQAVDEEAVDSIIQKNTLTSEKIFESIENGLIVADTDNRITLFNQMASLMTGVPRREAIGRNIEELFPKMAITEVLKDGRERKGKRHKFGKYQVIIDCSPVIVEEKIVGAVAVMQDISQIEALSWELRSVRELEGKLVSILEAVYDGICMIDDEQKITYANAAFASLLKCRPSELTEHPIDSIFPGEKIPDGFFDTKQETILTNPDGREFMLDIQPIAVDSQITGNVIVARELTEITKLALKVEELSARTDYLQEELDKRQQLNASFDTIVGQSGVLIEALSVASRAAQTDATVLIRGESGTGKELVAKAIHHASSRRNKAFVSMNCAAIPAELLEAELFGYEKGAFTGAVREKPGKFELADGGTIFLDEIGDMDLAMQAKLLRVLQEQEIERIGGVKPKKINVRIIAATNAALEKMMEQKRFRSDLYYRLDVISVVLPPLRMRKGDIPMLTEFFIERICNRYKLPKKKITIRALQALERYHYPGNIRELENMIERGITLCEDTWIDLRDLPSYVSQLVTADGDNIPNPESDLWEYGENIPTMAEAEERLIRAALKKYPSFRQAAKALNIDHKTVSAKVKRYGIL